MGCNHCHISLRVCVNLNDMRLVVLSVLVKLLLIKSFEKGKIRFLKCMMRHRST